MLIKRLEHDGGVLGYVLVVLLVIVGPLACFAGVDSRIDEKSRRRRYTL